MTTKTIDTILSEARVRLRRLSPQQARTAWAEGALLIDIRPSEQRQHEGEIPGATILERNVLEWRLDPASPNRIAEIDSHEVPVILFCQEGYASSLAAVSLQALGLVNATDLEGGIVAWAEAGLPVRRGHGERAASGAAAVSRGTSRRRPSYSDRPEDFRHNCRFC